MRPVHPAAELFPLMEGDEFDALVEDIRTHGLVEPVWLWRDADGTEYLLDGRNRQRACDAAAISVRTRWYEGDDPIGFSISQNAQRRHLSAGQRAAVAAAVLPLYEAQAAKRKAHGQTAPGKPKETLPADRQEASEARHSKKRERESTERAAKAAGSSGRSVARFKRIEKADPGLANLVKANTISLERAERILRDRESEARKVEEALSAAAAQDIPSTLDIRHGDFREVLADLTDVDAIITDPPYPAEFLPLLADLAAWADKVLAPDGVLAVLMGQTHLPEVYRLLDGYRPYRWTCAYLTSGAGYVSHPRRVQSNWKPLIVYGGGPRFVDVLRAEGTDAGAKSLHKWGQDYSAFHTLIERLTKPGQTVVDPFMGSGTTLLAAHALGRHAIGCDVDEDSVVTARERVA